MLIRESATRDSLQEPTLRAIVVDGLPFISLQKVVEQYLKHHHKRAYFLDDV